MQANGQPSATCIVKNYKYFVTFELLDCQGLSFSIITLILRQHFDFVSLFHLFCFFLCDSRKLIQSISFEVILLYTEWFNNLTFLVIVAFIYMLTYKNYIYRELFSTSTHVGGPTSHLISMQCDQVGNYYFFIIIYYFSIFLSLARPKATTHTKSCFISSTQSIRGCTEWYE